MRDVPPEFDDVVNQFENRMAEIRTRLIRQRAAITDEHPPPVVGQAATPAPVDTFDVDHPISSSGR